jgi:cytochrome c553
MSAKKIVFLGVLFLFLVLGMAWAQEGGAPNGTKVSTSTCLSGVKWTAGDQESPEMHPGRSCIDCHAKGEGPKFIVAGTVYQQLTEPDDCYGVEGVVVQLTDSKGMLFKMTSNKAGNFYLRARGTTIAFPFTAKVIFKGKENEMGTPQSTGNCASCHTATGANDAPGRVIIPPG